MTALRSADELQQNHANALRQAEKRIAKLVKRDVKRMTPKGLDDKNMAEFQRVAALLAHPSVDRLKAHYMDAILEYCEVCVRLRAFREYFQGDIRREIYNAGAQPAAQPGQPAPPVTRNGVQIKSHPFVAQRNEAWRQWRSLVAILGLSPTDERNMAPGLGDLGDPTDKYFQ